MSNLSNILIIFDEDIDVNSLYPGLSRLSPKSIHLFPLTSNWGRIYNLKSIIKHLFSTDIEIKIKESRPDQFIAREIFVFV